MSWSHANERSVGYLHVLWSRDCKIPYMYLTCSVRLAFGHPRVPCGFHTGMGTSVRLVLREPYGPVRMPYGLGNTLTISSAGHTGSGEARGCNKTTNWPSMGTKS